MINVYQFYLDVLDRLNKEENGYFKVDVYNRLLRYSSNELEGQLVRGLQDETLKDKHQYYLDVLHPFNKRQIILINSNGFCAAPDDYEHFSALRVRYDGTESYNELIRLHGLLCEAEDDPTINQAEINNLILDLQAESRYIDVPVYPHANTAKRLTSRIPSKRPTVQKPIGEYAAKGWQIYPINTASGLLLYYRTPAVAQLVMVLNNATGNIEYDAVTSVNIEWSVKAERDLLERIVSDFSIYLRERELFEMMEVKQQKK